MEPPVCFAALFGVYGFFASVQIRLPLCSFAVGPKRLEKDGQKWLDLAIVAVWVAGVSVFYERKMVRKVYGLEARLIGQIIAEVRVVRV